MASSNIRIESAYYGDEKSFSNITASFINRVIGGNIAVTANGDLKPTFEAATETKLEPSDEKEIREDSVKACGGEADQKCLEATKLKLAQEKLKEKERTDLGKGVMKGDRLTVNIVDGNGKRRTLITPAGQEFKLQNVIGGATNTATALPTLAQTQERFITIISVIIGAFIWVFSIVANYAIFMREAVATGKDSFRIVAYVTTVIAALFPGSGLFILMFWFGFQSFVREYVART
jgi:hypothetical protein